MPRIPRTCRHTRTRTHKRRRSMRYRILSCKRLQSMRRRILKRKRPQSMPRCLPTIRQRTCEASAMDVVKM